MRLKITFCQHYYCVSNRITVACKGGDDKSKVISDQKNCIRNSIYDIFDINYYVHLYIVIING